MKSAPTISRLYDQYLPKDFNVGDDNLNPKRDMLMDQIPELEKKIQVVADRIIKKKIEEAKAQTVSVNFGGGNRSGNTPASKGLKINLGTLESEYFAPLPNEIIGSVLRDGSGVNELVEPITLDCSATDALFNTSTDSSSDSSSSDDSSGLSVDSSSDSSSTSSLSSSSCSEIELAWLKYILEIVKVLNILKRIYDLCFSVVNPTVQICMLLINCWVNPTSGAVAGQYLASLITSICTTIVAKLIQFLWDMLNLDCIADVSKDLMNQITSAMQDLSSAIGLMSPNNLDFDALGTEVEDGWEDIVKAYDEKREEWEKFDWSKEWGDFTESFSSEMDNFGTSMLNDGVLSTGAAKNIKSTISVGSDMVSSIYNSKGDESSIAGACTSMTSGWSSYVEEKKKAIEAAKAKEAAEAAEKAEAEKAIALEGVQLVEVETEGECHNEES